MLNWKIKIYIAFCLVLCTSPLTWARAPKSYEHWVPVDRNDVWMTGVPHVLIEGRLQLIRQAKQTLDVVTYDQRLDKAVGEPILNEIEAAAKRNVRVRFAASKFMTPFVDPLGKVARRLKGIAKKYPDYFQFTFVGGFPMLQKGWDFMDGIHEKLIIVDGKLAMTSGAGHSDQYLHWLDTAFFFKGNLVASAVSAFDQLWKTILAENPKNGMHHEMTTEERRFYEKEEERVDLSPIDVNVQTVMRAKYPDEARLIDSPDLAELAFEGESRAYSLSADETEKVEFLISWMEIDPEGRHDYRGRILHFDLLEQLRALSSAYHVSPCHYSLDQRIDKLFDPIVEEIIRQVPTASKFTLNTYSTNFTYKLRDALDMATRRTSHPLHVEVFTNSEGSHRSIHKLGPNIGWIVAVPDLEHLLSLGQAPGPSVTRVHLLRSSDDPNYLHRKLFVIEKGVLLGKGGDKGAHSGKGLISAAGEGWEVTSESITAFGSHNGTYGSTALDEMNIEIESDDFATRTNTEIIKVSRSDFDDMTLSQAEEAKKHNETNYFLWRVWKWLF